MVNPNPVGIFGEKLTHKYLLSHGYFIVSTNYTTRYGELDVIATKDDKIVFVEVKTRIHTSKGMPYEAVNNHKIVRMGRAIRMFLSSGKYRAYKLSAWVVSIVLSTEMRVLSFNVYDDLPLHNSY